MNALQSYSSDEDSGSEIQEVKMNKECDPGTNYEDVGMDISEESGDSDAETDGTTTASTVVSSNGDHRRASIGEAPKAAVIEKRTLSDSSTDRTKSNDLKDIRTSKTLKKMKKESESSSASKSSKDLSKHSRKTRSRSRDRKRKKDRSRSRGRKRSRSRSKGRRSRSKGRRSRSRSKGRGRTRSKSRSKGRGRSRSRSRGRGSRRSRSRSRGRRRSRSRSRGRRRSRSHSRGFKRSSSRSRSRDRDRRPALEIRKEAQQRLAQFQASNPGFTQEELIKQGLVAQLQELQKVTGLNLPTYYNPSVINPLKLVEQERKKKLLWGNKSKPAESSTTAGPTAAAPAPGGTIWSGTRFANDDDGKVAEKFKRLMGVKGNEGSADGASSASGSTKPRTIVDKQESMFTDMEKQYEVARMTTHTHRGVGLGFSSQVYFPK